MDNNKVLTMIEDEMPSVMKKCEKRYRLSEFWFYEDIHDWVFTAPLTSCGIIL